VPFADIITYDVAILVAFILANVSADPFENWLHAAYADSSPSSLHSFCRQFFYVSRFIFSLNGHLILITWIEIALGDEINRQLGAQLRHFIAQFRTVLENSDNC